MDDPTLKKELTRVRKQFGKVYSPLKYFRGLDTPKEIETRYKRILKGIKDPNNFSKFKTDKGKVTKRSSYTKKFEYEYPNAKSLEEKAKVTGIPEPILKKVYNKGLAAWRTGHRPGATGQQWGYARVHSFIMKGCTFHTADKSLVNEALEVMKSKDIKKWLNRNSTCKR